MFTRVTKLKTMKQIPENQNDCTIKAYHFQKIHENSTKTFWVTVMMDSLTEKLNILSNIC